MPTIIPNIPEESLCGSDFRYRQRVLCIPSLFGGTTNPSRVWEFHGASALRANSEYVHAALQETDIPLTASPVPAPALSMSSLWRASRTKWYWSVIGEPKASNIIAF